MMTPDNEVLLVCGKCGWPSSAVSVSTEPTLCSNPDCRSDMEPSLTKLVAAMDEADERGPAAQRDFELELRLNHERFARERHGRRGRR